MSLPYVPCIFNGGTCLTILLTRKFCPISFRVVEWRKYHVVSFLLGNTILSSFCRNNTSRHIWQCSVSPHIDTKSSESFEHIVLCIMVPWVVSVCHKWIHSDKSRSRCLSVTQVNDQHLHEKVEPAFIIKLLQSGIISIIRELIASSWHFFRNAISNLNLCLANTSDVICRMACDYIYQLYIF